MKLNEIRDVGRRIDQGAWVGDLPNLPGVRVRVRGLFNASYNRLMQKMRNDYTPEQLRDEKVQDTIDINLTLDAILLDWDGIEDENEQVPYSREVAQQLLTDPDMDVFRRAVAYASSIVAREGQDKVKDDVKNSRKRSAGK